MQSSRDLLDWLLAVYKIAFPVLVCQALMSLMQYIHLSPGFVAGAHASVWRSAQVCATDCAGVPDAGEGLWAGEGGGLAG